MARRLLPLLPGTVVVAVFLAVVLQLCSLLHLCGCASPWGGAATRCNVHAREGPRCPWCVHPWLGAVAFGVTMAGQAGVYRLVRRRGASGAAATVAAVSALPLAVALGGAIAWLPTDYPHFLVTDARARLGLPDGPIGCYAPSRALESGRHAGTGPSVRQACRCAASNIPAARPASDERSAATSSPESRP